MIEDREIKRSSKFLSLVLRHKPHHAKLTLDSAGWADVQAVLEGTEMCRWQLQYVVDTNAKNRFEFSEDGTKIRARQGHSVPVDLGYEEAEPPEYLYHGTADKNWQSILRSGIEPRSRHHVHLSEDVPTAIKVGQRHGKPIALQVSAQQMYLHGVKFYKTGNNVWLVDFVPPTYINDSAS